MGLHVQVVPCPLKISCLGWKKKFFFGHIINPCTDKAYSFKMTGYWPHFVLHFKARVSASQQGFIVHSPHPVLMLQQKCTLFKQPGVSSILNGIKRKERQYRSLQCILLHNFQVNIIMLKTKTYLTDLSLVTHRKFVLAFWQIWHAPMKFAQR